MTERNLEWSDVRIFLSIARSGTLGAAAKQVGQTQPTMGRRLRSLEETVGHVLFRRTRDGFVLTDEGAAVLAYAERMEEEALGFLDCQLVLFDLGGRWSLAREFVARR